MTTERASGKAPIARLRTIFFAFHQSLVLRELVALGVLDQLAAGPRTAAELAAACGASEHGIEHLLNLTVTHGLLELVDRRYRIAPDFAPLLTPGLDTYLGVGNLFNESLEQTWREGLHPAVVQGISPFKRMTGWDPERVREFTRTTYALTMAERPIVESIELRGRRRLLDVGGRSGACSIILCERYPDLRATIYDREPMLEVAAENVARHGLSGRIDLLPGHYLDPAYPAGYDALLLSTPLHAEPEPVCREVFARARATLEPGGTIVVLSMLLLDDRTGPFYGAFIQMNQLIVNPDGGSPHPTAEYRTWLADAGFVQIETHEDLAYETVVVTGRAPG